MGDLTFFEVLTGGAFDRLNGQHSGEFDQNFSQKSNAWGFARGGGGVGMGGFGIDRYIISYKYKPSPLVQGGLEIPICGDCEMG